MNVKFYSLNSLPTANSNAAGSFVHVTTGENAGMWYCTGSAMIRLDNVAQDRASEVKSASIETTTGVASFKNAKGVEVFSLNLADYLAAEIAKLTGSATIASVVEGVVTIKTGVSEANGKIGNAEGEDIVLAKVATTGKAVDILLDPSASIGNNNNAKTTVQAAIEALATAFDGLVTDTQDLVKAHADNTTVHITADERTAWNGEIGAKAAASAAQTDATSALTKIGDENSGLTKAVADNKAAIEAEVTRATSAESTLAGRLDVIEGEGEGSIKKAAADAVAEVVAGANSDFDTLKEVADWIANDTTGAAKLQSDVAILRGADTVEGSVAKAEKDAKAYTDERIGNLGKVSEEEGAADHTVKSYVDKKIQGLGDAAYTGVENANANQYVKVSEVSNNKQTLSVTIGKFTVPASGSTPTEAQVPGLATVEDVEKIITDNEKVTAASLNDLGKRVNDLETTTGNYDNVYSKLGHTHAISEVTGLQDALDGKAAADHNHDAVYDSKGSAEAAKLAVIGNDDDTKDSDTVKGAKKYTDAAVEAAKLVWLTEWPTA